MAASGFDLAALGVEPALACFAANFAAFAARASSFATGDGQYRACGQTRLDAEVVYLLWRTLAGMTFCKPLIVMSIGKERLFSERCGSFLRNH